MGERLTRRDFLKIAGTFIVGPVILQACRTLGISAPTLTETSTAFPKETETLTPEPTPTPTPEAPEKVFIPEGFQIGELGLLQNPETGRNILAMNPEADWEKRRKEIIGNFWEASVEWARFTGQGCDASRMTKEAFLAKALSGEELTFGIPIRADTKGLEDKQVDYSKDWPKYPAYVGDVELKIVTARLNDMVIQALTGSQFMKYMGEKSWTAEGQEAWDPIPAYLDLPYNALHFAEKDGKIIITVGSYYTGNQVPTTRSMLVGDFKPELAQKYKSYYREDGIGFEANQAITKFLYWGISELGLFPVGKATVHLTDGSSLKFISVFEIYNKTPIAPEEFSPPLFIFSQ